jgi:hypothetical protein
MINTRKLWEFCTTFPKNFMFSDKIPMFDRKIAFFVVRCCCWGENCLSLHKANLNDFAHHEVPIYVFGGCRDGVV